MSEAAELSKGAGAKRLSWGLLARLSVLNFLQFVVWGAWYSVFGEFMRARGFTSGQVAWTYSLLPLACIIAPFIGGQIADRWVPTQFFLAAAHLLGGLAMLAAAAAFDRVEPQAMLLLLFAWCFMYAPTLALTNSLCFHHLPSGERDFGKVRVWGTIGWIIIGWFLAFWLNVNAPDKLPSMLQWAAGPVHWFGGMIAALSGRPADPQNSDCLRLAGVVSLLMAAYCLTLPHTPPQKNREKPWAFLEAFKMLRDWHFAVFMGISFLVSTELMFYYQFTGQFLVDVGIARSNISMVMTLAQIAEILTLSLVGWFLPRWGLKWAMSIGILSWPLRYAIFAVGRPAWLMVAALPLHGICFVCFFVIAFIYVDKTAPAGVRASAQSLFNIVVFGLGMFLGAQFCGLIQDAFTVAHLTNGTLEQVTNWRAVFLVPVVITTCCAIMFFSSFKEPRNT